jgi:hypothetical protein
MTKNYLLHISCFIFRNKKTTYSAIQKFNFSNYENPHCEFFAQEELFDKT